MKALAGSPAIEPNPAPVHGFLADLLIRLGQVESGCFRRRLPRACHEPGRLPRTLSARRKPEQAKTQLGILIADMLRLLMRSDVLPTYLVGAPSVCAPTSSVGETWQRANHALMAALALAIF